MEWQEYYDRYSDWQESTQYSRLSSITDFGPQSSPSYEIVDCAYGLEEKAARHLLKLAMMNGVTFTGSEVAEIIEGVTEDESVVLSLFRTMDLSTLEVEDLESIVYTLGDEDPVLELIDDLCELPFYFDAATLIEVCEQMGNDDYMEKLLLANRAAYTAADIDALNDLPIHSRVVEEIAKRNGICLDPVESKYVAPPRKKTKKQDLGFWPTIGLFIGAKHIVDGIMGDDEGDF